LCRFAELHQGQEDESFCVSFYGWNMIDLFMAAWRGADEAGPGRT
jgi:hypothetical protein